MNYLSQILKAISNVKAHPKTTIFGALLAVLTSLTGTADLKHAVLALLILLLGALARDPVSK